MAELRAGHAGHAGLVVLVNKYDGIDLPGKACEMLIIDGIARPMSAADRREAAALLDIPARRGPGCAVGGAEGTSAPRESWWTSP